MIYPLLDEFQNQIIYLKIENEILKKHGNFFAFSNKEKTKIVEEFKSKFPISYLLKILNLKKSTYYKCKIAIKNNIDKDVSNKDEVIINKDKVDIPEIVDDIDDDKFFDDFFDDE